jgi:hypothetical protein
VEFWSIGPQLPSSPYLRVIPSPRLPANVRPRRTQARRGPAPTFSNAGSSFRNPPKVDIRNPGSRRQRQNPPKPRSAEPFGSELKAELLTAEAPLERGGLFIQYPLLDRILISITPTFQPSILPTLHTSTDQPVLFCTTVPYVYLKVHFPSSFPPHFYLEK